MAKPGLNVDPEGTPMSVRFTFLAITSFTVLMPAVMGLSAFAGSIS